MELSKFESISFGSSGYDWNKGLLFDSLRGDALISDIRQFWKCTMERDEMQFTIYDWKGGESGWVQYDVEDSPNIHLQRCCVVGRNQQRTRCCILVLKPTDLNEEHKRIGWGYVNVQNVSRVGFSVRIV